MHGGAVGSPPEGGREDRWEVCFGDPAAYVLQHHAELVVADGAQELLTQVVDDFDEFRS
ncbi:hypothetical protein [Streptomyces sp. NPDC057428]|uniref:hypothetical protein n=1 Tax=Streptomyces sp. NPDC057428 TaxID=3346129 RepID=UPI0036ABBE1B